MKPWATPLCTSLALLVSASGCAGYRMAAGGATLGIGEDAHDLGAVIDLEQGLTMPSADGQTVRRSPIGLAANLRVKIVDEHVQAAPGIALLVIPVTGIAMPFFDLGARLFQIDASADGVGAGAFSPFASLGLIIGVPGESIATERAAGGLGFVVHVAGGYDLWFHDLPNSWWISASLGIAYFFGVS